MLLKEKLHNIPFLLTGNFGLSYYQEIAVSKVMESIADGQDRILLTLATGTGQTFISFQIVHKLLQAKWNLDGNDRRPRVLFLADRNVLADQAINTFNPYEKDVVKIDDLEAITGLDFFASFDKATQDRLESTKDIKQWFVKN